MENQNKETLASEIIKEKIELLEDDLQVIQEIKENVMKILEKCDTQEKKIKAALGK